MRLRITAVTDARRGTERLFNNEPELLQVEQL